MNGRRRPAQTEEIRWIAEAAEGPGGRAGARLGAAGPGGRAGGSVEQTVEGLSRDVARLRRQLTKRQAP